MTTPQEALLARRAPTADVALLLEGTYPYVSGGVSSWVHQMLRGFPDLRFALVFIGSRREDYGAPRYDVPANVVHFQQHYLYEREEAPDPARRTGDAAVFEKVARMHEYFRAPLSNAGDAPIVGEVSDELMRGLPMEDFLYSERAWDYVREQFNARSADPSFVDYFWTVRMMHAPIWRLAAIRDGMPRVKVFHTVSTGYAGLLGAMCRRRYDRPLVVSEHGIYTKERKIDLFGAQWITDNRSIFDRDTAEISYFRQIWIRFFEAIGRTAYDAADHVVALYEANRVRQVADGADPRRTRNIPNGIPIERFAAARARREPTVPQVMCLIGRVVPIKDVKTFIRAMRIAVTRAPAIEGWIAGPIDEDPAYADECRALVRTLGLEANVKLLGMQDVTQLLPRVGVVVLSSISEALPLSVLEGFAAGVPAVCTDVGSCRQLVYGGIPEDQALGPAGSVVGIADAQALADAALALLADPPRWQAAAAAATARVERHYTEKLMLDSYRALYAEALARPLDPPPAAATDVAAAGREGR
jgi:glycosyltransferase involved in cell wall biosynthesis